MMYVEGEMLTISEGVSSPPVFSGGFVDQYFVFCAMFCPIILIVWFITLIRHTLYLILELQGI
jgi:hypothetical protein